MNLQKLKEFVQVVGRQALVLAQLGCVLAASLVIVLFVLVGLSLLVEEDRCVEQYYSHKVGYSAQVARPDEMAHIEGTKVL